MLVWKGPGALGGSSAMSCPGEAQQERNSFGLDEF